ncbi:MAG: NTP transferase domain-containing protein [bacterium]
MRPYYNYPVDIRSLKIIFTCGGRLAPPLASRAPGGVKALLPVGGRSLLEHAIRAASVFSGLQVSGAAVVGPPKTASAMDAIRISVSPPFEIRFAAEGETVLDNMHAGAAALADMTGDRLLIISPDLPFVSGDALLRFAAAVPEGADLAMPLVRREDFLDEFPGAPNKFVRLVEGEVTLGSVLYIKGDVLRKNTALFQDAHNARKNPAKIAGMLGAMFVMKLLAGRLSLSEIERRIGQLTDAKVSAVFPSAAALAYDVDDEANLRYAEERIAKR